MKVTGSKAKYDVLQYDDVLKSHLKIDSDTDRDLIKVYIAAAGRYIEKYVGYPLLSCEVTTVNTVRNGMLELVKGSAEITTVEKRGSNGAWLEIELEDPVVDDYNNTVYLMSDTLEEGEEYRVTSLQDGCFSDIITHAALLLVAEMYEQRENRPEKYASKVNNILDMEILPI